MSVDRSAQAREISIKYAKEAKRPLEIWPGDENIKIEQLPEVGSEWKLHIYRAITITAAEFSFIPLLTVGRKYGIITKSYVPGVGLEYVVGEWR